MYVVTNLTTGGYAITIGSSTGTIIIIPNGVTVQVYTDGTNFYSAQTGSAGNFNVNGTLTAAGEVDTGNMTIGGTLAVTGATTLSSGTISGIVTAPTATPGTNTTQLATTAFVATATGSLGTMATQNANAVAITGGTISGLSSLSTSAGASIGGILVAVSPNSGSTGGIQVKQNAGGGNVYVQFTNNTGTAEYGDISATPAGVINLSPATAGAAQVSGNKILTTATKLGLGITGETWQSPGKNVNITYTNSYSYPIMVSATNGPAGSSPYMTGVVNGVQITQWFWQFNGAGAQGGTIFLVPPGATYYIGSGNSAYNWVELY
jgi:hypothetical protein